MTTATTTHQTQTVCRRLDKRFNARQREHASFDSGWALSFHSRFNHTIGMFERTELGELVHKMKYRYNMAALVTLAELMAERIKSRLNELNVDATVFSAVIPIPPSKTNRPYQPVEELARLVAQRLGIPCDTKYLFKSAVTKDVKSLTSYKDKAELLRDAMQTADQRYAGKRVLVIDDIVDSGATLDMAAHTLKSKGQVDRVYVLCATETLGKQ